MRRTEFALLATFAIAVSSGSSALALDGTHIPIVPPVASGDVDGFTLTPDGSTLVIVASLDNGNGDEAYAVPAGGGNAVLLSDPNGDVDDPPIADNTYAYFLDDDGDGNSNNRWWRRSLDGSGSVEQITPDDSEADAALIDGGATFVYLEDGPDVVSSVPTSGTLVMTQLSEAGNDVDQAQWDITSDGSTLIYGKVVGGGQPTEFASVATDGTTAMPNQILPVGLSPFAEIVDMAISPDDSTIYFTADQDIDGAIGLYSMPIAGGAITPIIAATDASREVSSFFVSPDGTKVAFSGDLNTDDLVELYVANIDGTGLTNLTPGLASLAEDQDVQGGAGDIVWSPDSVNIYFVSDQRIADTHELFVIEGTPVPEPTTLALAGLTLLGAAATRKRLG